MNLWLEKMSLVLYVHGDGVMATGYGLNSEVGPPLVMEMARQGTAATLQAGRASS